MFNDMTYYKDVLSLKRSVKGEELKRLVVALILKSIVVGTKSILSVRISETLNH